MQLMGLAAEGRAKHVFECTLPTAASPVFVRAGRPAKKLEISGVG
jgi:hypothetical protein